MANKPDWNVSVLNTETQEKGQIGVAWNNDDGSIYLKLNQLVVLPAGKHLQVRLFRIESQAVKKAPKTSREPPDDDQPF